MNYLFFDTETSSLPQPNYPDEHPSQARIMQFAMVLTDEKLKTVGSFVSLIRIPANTIISPEATARHNIQMSDCQDKGIPIESALMVFDSWYVRAGMIVGHGLDFDKKMVLLEQRTIFGPENRIREMDKQSCCTMKSMTPVCKLGFNGTKLGKYANTKGNYKWPKLQEALDYIFGTGQGYQFDAHNALADVEATILLFKWMQENRIVAVQ